MDLNLEPTPENPAQKRKIAMGMAIASAVLIIATLFTHGWLRAPEQADLGFGLMSIKACTDGVCKSESNRSLINEHNREVEREIADWGTTRSKKAGPAFWIAGYATLVTGLDAAIALLLSAVLIAQGGFFLSRRASAIAGAFMILHVIVPVALVMDGITGPASSIVWSALTTLLLAVGAVKNKLPDRISPTSLAMAALFLALVSACIFVATNPSRGGEMLGAQLGVGWAFWAFGVGTVGGIAAVPMLLKFKPTDLDTF